jgi:phosphomevalonate kinase
MIEKERKPSRVIRFPSKVLLAGGYSVLQASNQGLVIALENYFYSFYLDIGNIDSETMTNIEVLSPQIDGKWKY